VPWVASAPAGPFKRIDTRSFMLATSDLMSFYYITLPKGACCVCAGWCVGGGPGCLQLLPVPALLKPWRVAPALPVSCTHLHTNTTTRPARRVLRAFCRHSRGSKGRAAPAGGSTPHCKSTRRRRRSGSASASGRASGGRRCRRTGQQPGELAVGSGLGQGFAAASASWVGRH
jgi:hypothetical protein